jgi:hypothetical protein
LGDIYEACVAVEKALSRWLKFEEKLYEIFEQIYPEPNGSAEVLVAVLKQFDDLSQGELVGYCGRPLRSRWTGTFYLATQPHLFDNTSHLLFDDNVQNKILQRKLQMAATTSQPRSMRRLR